MNNTTNNAYDARSENAKMGCAREITVGEVLDRRIEKAERSLRALHDLKASLPGNFLNSGASRISAFIEL